MKEKAVRSFDPYGLNTDDRLSKLLGTSSKNDASSFIPNNSTDPVEMQKNLDKQNAIDAMINKGGVEGILGTIIDNTKDTASINQAAVNILSTGAKDIIGGAEKLKGDAEKIYTSGSRLFSAGEKLYNNAPQPVKDIVSTAVKTSVPYMTYKATKDVVAPAVTNAVTNVVIPTVVNSAVQANSDIINLAGTTISDVTGLVSAANHLAAPIVGKAGDFLVSHSKEGTHGKGTGIALQNYNKGDVDANAVGVITKTVGGVIDTGLGILGAADKVVVDELHAHNRYYIGEDAATAKAKDLFSQITGIPQAIKEVSDVTNATVNQLVKNNPKDTNIQSLVSATNVANMIGEGVSQAADQGFRSFANYTVDHPVTSMAATLATVFGGVETGAEYAVGQGLVRGGLVSAGDIIGDLGEGIAATSKLEEGASLATRFGKVGSDTLAKMLGLTTKVGESGEVRALTTAEAKSALLGKSGATAIKSVTGLGKSVLGEGGAAKLVDPAADYYFKYGMIKGVPDALTGTRDKDTGTIDWKAGGGNLLSYGVNTALTWEGYKLGGAAGGKILSGDFIPKSKVSWTDMSKISPYLGKEDIAATVGGTIGNKVVDFTGKTIVDSTERTRAISAIESGSKAYNMEIQIYDVKGNEVKGTAEIAKAKDAIVNHVNAYTVDSEGRVYDSNAKPITKAADKVKAFEILSNSSGYKLTVDGRIFDSKGIEITDAKARSDALAKVNTSVPAYSVDTQAMKVYDTSGTEITDSTEKAKVIVQLATGNALSNGSLNYVYDIKGLKITDASGNNITDITEKAKALNDIINGTKDNNVSVKDKTQEGSAQYTLSTVSEIGADKKGVNILTVSDAGGNLRYKLDASSVSQNILDSSGTTVSNPAAKSEAIIRLLRGDSAYNYQRYNHDDNSPIVQSYTAGMLGENKVRIDGKDHDIKMGDIISTREVQIGDKVVEIPTKRKAIIDGKEVLVSTGIKNINGNVVEVARVPQAERYNPSFLNTTRDSANGIVGTTRSAINLIGSGTKTGSKLAGSIIRGVEPAAAELASNVSENLPHIASASVSEKLGTGAKSTLENRSFGVSLILGEKPVATLTLDRGLILGSHIPAPESMVRGHELKSASTNQNATFLSTVREYGSENQARIVELGLGIVKKIQVAAEKVSSSSLPQSVSLKNRGIPSKMRQAVIDGLKDYVAKGGDIMISGSTASEVQLSSFGRNPHDIEVYDLGTKDSNANALTLHISDYLTSRGWKSGKDFIVYKNKSGTTVKDKIGFSTEKDPTTGKKVWDIGLEFYAGHKPDTGLGLKSQEPVLVDGLKYLNVAEQAGKKLDAFTIFTNGELRPVAENKIKHIPDMISIAAKSGVMDGLQVESETVELELAQNRIRERSKIRSVV